MCQVLKGTQMDCNWYSLDASHESTELFKDSIVTIHIKIYTFTEEADIIVFAVLGGPNFNWYE